MKGKRWLTLLLAAAMLLPQTISATDTDAVNPETVQVQSESDVSVPAEDTEPTVGSDAAEDAVQVTANNTAAEMPAVKEMIYENDFSDAAKTDNINLTPGDGTAEISGGTLNLTHTAGSNWTGADIYANADKTTTVSGTLGVEYTLKRSAVQSVQQRLRIGGTSDYVALTWNANKSVTSQHMLSADGSATGYSYNYTTGTANELKIQVYMDTSKSTFSVWINGEAAWTDVYARNAGANKLAYVRLYLETVTTLNIDDFKIFYADPPAEDAVEGDLEWLTDARIMTGNYVSDKTIMDDLSLPTLGNYGSTITWVSNDSDLIRIEEEDGALRGVVTRPQNVGENPEVTVTATVTKGEVTKEKSFTFRILQILDNAQEAVEAEMENLTLSSWNNDPLDAVITSLDLRTQGLYGTDISWSSSNTAVIENSGRVIRPRSDKQNETVTMTATITMGSIAKSKTFEVTVLKDEAYTDPQWVTDEDFFGVWNGVRWKKEGKFDYSEMPEVEAAVKEGDYAKAKDALLTYMKNRNQASPVAAASRNSGWADMCLAGVYNLQGASYYDGIGVANSNDYQQIGVDVTKGHIAKGGDTTYSIIARNNENSEMLIAGTGYTNATMRPKMELVVNGQTRTYDAVKSATIRAGNYKDVHYGTDEELKVKIFGDFLGDETYRSLISFNFGDLTDSDTVSSARLLLYAKVNPSFVSQKSFIVNFEPTNTWKSEQVVWSDLTGYVYNYNGVPGGCTWDAVSGCDAEYTYQVPRFLAWRGLTAEYEYTGDEKYAYFMIRDMMDFIWDKGEPYAYGGNGQWPRTGTIGMGWPRTLDTASRLEGWVASWNALVKSPYMNGEMCCAILKGIYEMTNNLPKSRVTQGNWVQTEQTSVVYGALFFPEFKESGTWLANAQAKLEDLMFTNNFDDGSYIEATGGYNTSAYTTFLQYKQMMSDYGHDVSEQYDDMLLKAAYYNLLMKGPDGTKLQYGDEKAGSIKSQSYPELVTWYGDHEIEYIDSLGKKGTMPEWTSRMFMDSRVSYLRSDWSKKALYLFTNVRGGGQHAHADDNGLVVMAYGRTLLNDAGIFTYTDTDPMRIWGKSTQAHNTVEINDKSQNIAAAPALETRGIIHDFRTTNDYDFLSQSTVAYDGFDHQRTITFVKSGFWIVSDLMVPENTNKENDYKQIWHMLPAASMSTDSDDMSIASNYSSGANIIVASADAQDATVKEEMGYYDYSYQQVTENPYAYFEKSGVKGKTTFDTVLLPYKNPGQGEIEVERIDMGVPTYDVTAMKFTTTVNEKTTTNYYVMDYTDTPQQAKTIGNYVVYGKSATIVENEKGQVEELYLTSGTKVTTKDGTVLFSSETTLDGVSVIMKGTTVQIETAGDGMMYEGGQDLDLETLSLSTANTVKSVTVDGQYKTFTQTGNNVVLSNQNTGEVLENDAKPGNGFGGQTGGGGGGGGAATEPTTPVPTPTPTPGNGDLEPSDGDFADTKGHWAQEAIAAVAEKGVIKGKENGQFGPDDTVTRAELIAMAVRALGMSEQPYQGGFADVAATDWYAGVVQTALEIGLIAEAENFRPNDMVTREEMSKIFTGIAQSLEVLEALPDDYQTTFVDAESISEWARDYVKTAAYNGLMSGMEDGSFNPQGNATRAEAATVIYRILQKIVNE